MISNLRSGCDSPSPDRHGRWMTSSSTSNRSLRISLRKIASSKPCSGWLRLTDTERRRLATLAYVLGRQRLNEVATS